MNGSDILLDSNIIIYLSKRKINISDIFFDNTNYYISIITYMELLSYNFINKKEEDLILQILSSLKILNIDLAIANRVISLKKSRKIKLPDAIIVATAKYYNLILFTNDKQLLNIEDIKTKEIKVLK